MEENLTVQFKITTLSCTVRTPVHTAQSNRKF